MPSTEMTEPLRMIEALSLRCGSADCTVKNTPVRLVLMTFWNASILVAPSGVPPAMPALAKQDVVLAELFGPFPIAGFGRGNVRRVGHDRERFRAQLRGCGIERRRGFRPVMTTLAPSATNSLAVASPMPLLPPVINASCSRASWPSPMVALLN
jgi:hypothetical protein